MRMWNVPPKILCRKHLLGEHVEMHMFVGTLKKGTSVKGYIKDGLVNLSLILKRHNELAEEIEKRGYNHNSPITDEDYNLYVQGRVGGSVDIDGNLKELSRRCPDCKERIENE